MKATSQTVGDANKVAHYMLRWESTRGETGTVERDSQRDDWGLANRGAVPVLEH